MLILGAFLLWLAMALFYAYMASWRPPHPALTAIALAGLVAAMKSSAAPGVRLTAAMMTAQVMLVAWVGGDWSYLNHYWRLLAPVVPMVLVLGLAAVRRLTETRNHWAAAVFVAGCLILAAANPLA